MEMSQEIATLFEALVSFQAEVTPPAKDSTNPHFKSKYADLAAVIAAAKAPLAKNGLAVSQFTEGGDADGVTITTVLGHKSGQWMRASLRMPAKRSPQEFGSSISYGRRYALLAILGLAADDDDGEAAEGRGKNAHGRQQPRQQAQRRSLDDVAQEGGQEAPERPLDEAGQQRTTPSKPAEEKTHGATREGWELLFDGGPEDQWGLAMPNCEPPVFSQKSRFAGKSWSDPSVSGAVFLKFLEDGADEMTSVQRAWAEYRALERSVRKDHEAKQAKEQSNG